MTHKSELGKLGEELACKYLEEKKYKIIERNFKRPWGELDIVAMARDKTLVFVEVKTMSQPSFGGLKPENQMTAEKLRKSKKAASLYAGHNQKLTNDKKGWRLDLVAIDINDFDEFGEPIYKIRHYENVE